MINRLSGINTDTINNQHNDQLTTPATNTPEPAGATVAAESTLKQTTNNSAQPWQPVVRDRFTGDVAKAGLSSALSSASVQNDSDIDVTKLTKEDWQNRALQSAGIDPAQWLPSRGFEANKEIMNKVYDWYGKTYLNHNELEWAGLAKMAGGAVYGGLQKLVDTQKIPILGKIGAWLGNLDYTDRKLVAMCKDIFMDLSWQHEAYVTGGLKALEASYQNGDISRDNYNAWVDIASGDPTRISKGNEWLLRREQGTVLPPGYAQLDKNAGLATVAMSFLTKSPLPNGRSFEEVVPFGRISSFKDRWKWITNDMLPAWRSLSPEYKKVLVNQPLQQLAAGKFAPKPANSLSLQNDNQPAPAFTRPTFVRGRE